MSTQLNDILSKMIAEMGQDYVDTPLSELAVPACPECEDKGYVSYDVPVGDVRFGKLFRCSNPNCPTVLRQFSERTQKLVTFSDWQKFYSDWTFDSFKKLVGKEWEGKRGAYALARSFAIANGVAFTLDEAAQAIWQTNWPSKDKDTRKSMSVMLTGDVGLGKTSLAVAATNELLARSESVIFMRVRELIRRLQETYQRDWEGETTGNRIKFYASVPYLVLDEFGIKNYTDDRLELIESVIRDRDRQNLPFLATTNLSIDEFKAQWSPQVADIVQKAHWIEVSGVKLRETRQKVEAW